MVAVTVLVAVLITDTVLPAELVTKTSVPLAPLRPLAPFAVHQRLLKNPHPPTGVKHLPELLSRTYRNRVLEP
jgi:hypothetical protein